MNSLFPGPILPLELVPRNSASIFAEVVIALIAILFITVVLIIFRHDFSVRPFKSRNNSFDQGETK